MSPISYSINSIILFNLIIFNKINLKNSYKKVISREKTQRREREKGREDDK